MSKTWRGGRSARWKPDRWHERLAYKRGEDNWRKEVEEDMNNSATTIYIVRNFWTPAGQDFELSEDTFASFTEDAAWDVLFSLAEGRGVPIQMKDSSFECPTDAHIEREYYAIITLEVHDG